MKARIMEPQANIIHERRFLVASRARFLFIAPMVVGLAGLYAIHDRPHALMAGGPLLLLLIYGMLVLMTTYREVRLDANGFRVRSGPLLTGLRAAAHNKAEVRQLFPRYVRGGVAKGVVEDRYYAAVELTEGRWVNVRGHYPDWAKASGACAEVARCWGLDEVAAGRQGLPSTRDWTSAIVLLTWGGAFITAMLWAVIVEVRR